MGTKAELYEIVRDYLGRPNLANDKIDAMAMMVEGRLNTVLRNHPRMYVSIDIQSTDTQPTDETEVVLYEGVFPLPQDINQLGVLSDACGEIKQYPEPLLGKYARGFTQFGTKIGVCGASAPLYLSYWAMIPSLTETDSNWVLKHFFDVYVYGILSESRVYLRDDARLASYKTLFDQRLEELRLQGWGQNIASAPRVSNA
ncbi:hypothetical protein K0U83_21145 [bacterium]|nr:hypothetical protein [bacterium]